VGIACLIFFAGPKKIGKDRHEAFAFIRLNYFVHSIFGHSLWAELAEIGAPVQREPSSEAG
jgi:hypothetical protein